MATQQTGLTTTDGTAVARRKQFDLAPTDMAEAMKFAELMAGAGEAIPKEYRGKQAEILVAVAKGREIGLSPLQALDALTPINGRMTLWGDAMLGLVMQSGILVDFKERNAAEAFAANEGRCEVLRAGVPSPFVQTFSVTMAEKAGLINRSGASGPWNTHRGRMLQMRARAWTLRDAFPDVLKGLRMREEENDYMDMGGGVSVSMMPQRKSEAGQADVAGFLGNGSAHPRQASADAAPSSDGRLPGIVAEVTEKSGTTKGKPWTFYLVRLAEGGGEFSTFDRKLRDASEELLGQHVSIAWEPTSKGGKKLIGIDATEEPARQREAGEEG